MALLVVCSVPSKIWPRKTCAIYDATISRLNSLSGTTKARETIYATIQIQMLQCTSLVSQQLQHFSPVRRQFPMSAPLRHEAAAGVLFLFGFINREQLKSRFAFNFGASARNHLKSNPVEVE